MIERGLRKHLKTSPEFRERLFPYLVDGSLLQGVSHSHIAYGWLIVTHLDKAL